MTDGDPVIELQPRVRDVRILPGRSRRHPRWGRRTISPFSGILGLHTRSHEWSRQSFTFLTLAPLVVETLETRSKIREQAAEEHESESTESDHAEPQSSTTELQVRELIRQSDRAASTAQIERIDETTVRHGAPGTRGRDGDSGPPGEAIERWHPSNATRIPTGDRTPSPSNFEYTEVRSDQALPSSPISSRGDESTAEPSSQPPRDEKNGASGESPTDSSFTRTQTPDQLGEGTVDRVARSIQERSRRVTESVATPPARATVHEQRSVDVRRTIDPRVTRTESAWERPLDSPPSEPTVGMPIKPPSPIDDSTEGHSPSTGESPTLLTNEPPAGQPVIDSLPSENLHDPPSMHALQVPLPKSQNEGATGAPSQESGRGYGDLDGAVTNSPKRPTSPAAQAIDEPPSIDTHPEGSELLDRLDVNRLAKRLERVFDRNDRIERERRGR